MSDGGPAAVLAVAAAAKAGLQRLGVADVTAASLGGLEKRCWHHVRAAR